MRVEEILSKKINALGRRYRAIHAGRTVLIFLCYGLAFYLAFLIVDKFLHFSLNLPVLFLAVCAVSAIAGLIVARMNRMLPFDICSRVDQKLELKEKITTAWQYKDESKSNEFVPLLLKDALISLEDVKKGEVFPHIWLKGTKYLASLLVGISILSFSGYFYPLFERGLLSGEKKFLSRLTDRFGKKEREEIEKAEKLATRMRKLREDFYQSKLKREEDKKYTLSPDKSTQNFEVDRDELSEKLEGFSRGGSREGFSRLNNRAGYLPQSYMREGGEDPALPDTGQQSEAMRKMMGGKRGKSGENFFDSEGREGLIETGRKGEQSGFEKEEQSSARREGTGEKRNGEDEHQNQRAFTPASGKKKGENVISGEEKRGYASSGEESKDSSSEDNLVKGRSPRPGQGSSLDTQRTEQLKLDEEGDLIKLRGQFDRGSFLDSFSNSISSSQESPKSSIKENFLSYRRFILNKLAGERIPSFYREQVKKYFSSLEPE